MGTKVSISPLLQEHSGIPSSLEVEGSTVGQCLDDFISRYPQSRTWLFDQDGLLRIVVSINNSETVALDADGLGRTLNPDDTLEMLAVMGGG